MPDGTFPDMTPAKANASKPRKRQGPDWLSACQTDSNAEPRPNLFNVMLAMRDDPRICDLFAYDEMQCGVILQKPIPSVVLDPAAVEAFEPHPVKDADVSLLQELLQASGLEKIGKDVVHQAVDLRGRERSFHPVRNYLNSLQWDGTPRVDKWLHTYLGAEDNTYHSSVGRMFLIAMVARIFEPGCKCDYMLIFEGAQGLQKSTICKALVGEKWFSDNLPPLHGDAVRVSQHMQGKWLIEVAEMSAMSKAESADLKAFITRCEEKFTPKYGRKEVTELRQCVFIGTTNKETYLRDETGGRRFWPVKVWCINLSSLLRDRDQLFAEAVHLYRSGAQWWPDADFERDHIAPQQDARYEVDAWEQAISKWLAGRDATDKEPVTILRVARDAIYLDTPKLGTADQRRISAALERLGWRRGAKQSYGVPWHPPIPKE